MMPRFRSLETLAGGFIMLFSVLSARVLAQTNLNYRRPPKAIVDLVDILPTPFVEVSPADASGKKELLIEFVSGFPTIADLAQPELRLGGLRFNPKTNGPSRGRYLTSLDLKAHPEGAETTVSGLPVNAKIRFASWAPDGRSIMFVNTSDLSRDPGLSLWIVDVSTARARRVPGIALNGIFGAPCEWLSDSQSLLCKTVPKDRGAAPGRSEVPSGPVIQENLGRVTPGPTYEDLLKSPEDERIFDYYATSQVELIRLDGAATPVGKPGVIVNASPSPDAQYALIDERHHPYSYLLPLEFFPEHVSVINLKPVPCARSSTNRLKTPFPTFTTPFPPGRAITGGEATRPQRCSGWKPETAATPAKKLPFATRCSSSTRLSRLLPTLRLASSPIFLSASTMSRGRATAWQSSKSAAGKTVNASSSPLLPGRLRPRRPSPCSKDHSKTDIMTPASPLRS